MELDKKEDFDKISKLLAFYLKLPNESSIKTYLTILKKRRFRATDLQRLFENEVQINPKGTSISISNMNKQIITPLLSKGLITSIGKGRYNPVSPSLILYNLQNRIREDLAFLESINGMLEEEFLYAEEPDIDKDVSSSYSDLKGLLTELIIDKQKIRKLTIVDKDRHWIDINSVFFKDETIKNKVAFIKNEQFATGIIFCEYLDDEVCLFFNIYNPATTKVTPVKVKDNFLFAYLQKKVLGEKRNE